MKEYEKTGVLSLKDLRLPNKKQLEKGVAVIECVQNIPCNPCVDACPFNAISMEDVNALPVVDFDKCVGCGLCVRDCPADALQMDKKSREEYKLIYYPARCAYCGQCEDNCRHEAISHSNKLVKPTLNPEGLVVILHEKNGN